MASAKPILTFIVPCKGRLADLQKSLPLLIAQKGTNTIVVDADCPEGTAAWIQKNHPAAHVEKIERMEIFNLSAARNAGLPLLNTPWVCFIDADIMIAPDFWKRLRPLLKPGHFFRFQNTREKFGITGTVIAESDAVRRACGYDEVIQGYGGEDYELYASLARLGLKDSVLDDRLINSVAPNTNAQRSQFYSESNIQYSIVVNGLYRVLKNHVRNVQPGIDTDLAGRQKIYAEAQRAAGLARNAPDGTFEFDLPLPADPIIYSRYAELRQVLKLQLRLNEMLREAKQSNGMKPPA
jgi:glycosyltransferase involved in cell wall biosynthesis